MSEYEIPDSEFSGKNLSDYEAFFEVKEYGVGEWTPQRDGKGKPEALILHFDVELNLGKSHIVTFGIRLKSRQETQRLIAILQRHCDSVWPLS